MNFNVARFIFPFCIFLVHALNAVSQDLLPEARIFLHSPAGLRVEYSIDRSILEIWHSPGAGTDLDYRIRSFSNRYDHTRLFDEIVIAGLKKEQYVSTTYDPFQTTIHYQTNSITIRVLYDTPGVMIWLENSGSINIKTDKVDSLLGRNQNEFQILHPDRWEKLHFAAIIPDDAGEFRHMLDWEPGRSMYAQANLKAGRPLILLSSRFSKHHIDQTSTWKNANLKQKLAEEELKIKEALQMGAIRVKNDSTLQRLIDINRRVLISMQDHSGAMRAALIDYYYCIWARDGGIMFNTWAWSGNQGALSKWNDFMFANPTTVEKEEPKGKMYGQLISGNITKWQTDGNFFAVLNAFNEWSGTNPNEPYLKERMELLDEVVDWWERRDYDAENQMFGRYYVVETPTYESRGYGYDNADGNPGAIWAKYGLKYKGTPIKRAYDQYINRFAYHTYHMMADMEMDTSKSKTWRAKAQQLEPIIEQSESVLFPEYGKWLSTSDEWIDVDATQVNFAEFTDLMWAFSMSDFHPDYHRLHDFRKALLAHTQNSEGLVFLAGLFMLTSSIDPYFADQDDLFAFVKEAAFQSVAPGKMLPMAYAMNELLNVKDGDPYHDARPQAFSIGPFLATVSGQGVRRLSYGLALRTNSLLSELSGYEWHGHLLNFQWTGTGQINEILIDGKELKRTLQLPENEINADANIVISQKENAIISDGTWLKSTVRLINVNDKHFEIQAHGFNHVVFKGEIIAKLEDASGNHISTERIVKDGCTWYQFEGRGKYYFMVQTKD